MSGDGIVPLCSQLSWTAMHVVQEPSICLARGTCQSICLTLAGGSTRDKLLVVRITEHEVLYGHTTR